MTSLLDLHTTPGQGKAVDPLQFVHRKAEVEEAPASDKVFIEGEIPDATPEDLQAVESSIPEVVKDPTKADFSDRELLFFGEESLSTPPPHFDFDNPNYLDYAPSPLAFAEALFDRMLVLGGIGLSANQIGLPFRVFVFGNVVTKNYIFNPEVIGVSPETSLMEERCLSFPGLALTLARPEKCGVSFQNEKGEIVVATLEKLAARVFLHEYDHMEGVSFLAHASKFKQDWELAKLNKRIAKYKKLQKRLHNSQERTHGSTKFGTK